MKKKMRRRAEAPSPTVTKRQFRKKQKQDEEPAPKQLKRKMKKAVERKTEARLPEPYKGRLPLTKKSRVKGCINIPLEKAPKHEQFKPFDMSVVPKNVKVFYTFNKERGRVEQMTTVTSEGLHLGWATCGRCKYGPTTCSCPKGMVHPASVEYCLRSDQYRKDHGVSPPANHINVMDYLKPKYRDIDFDNKPFDRYARTTSAADRAARQALLNPTPTTKTGKRQLKRKTVDVADAKAVTKMTEKSTEQMTKTLRKSLGSDKPKRKLKRKV